MMLIVLALFAIWLSGCAAAAEKALEEATGFEWDIDNSNNAPVPENWHYLFAIKLDKDQASVIDQSFDYDFSKLKDLGVDTSEWTQFNLQFVFAKTDTVPNGSAGLRYANKIIINNDEIKLDGDSLTKLGPSIGSSGAGWYVCYAATKPVGFIKGEVTDCSGANPADGTVLVTASDGPFFTFAKGAGSWALPSLNGKPAMINFDAGDCTGQTNSPVTDPNLNPDPKDDSATPTGDKFDDGTNNGDLPGGQQDTGTNILPTAKVNLSNQGQQTPPANGTDVRYEFDDTTADWPNTGDCFTIIDNATQHDLLFPGNKADAHFAYISTGSPTHSIQACNIMRTFTVPSGKTKIVVSYDFVTQEYPEWVGSAYNDVATVQIQGEPDYIVHRTVNGDNNWADLSPTAGGTGDIGFVGDAGDTDASYNATGHYFDGHLKYTGTGPTTPRGENDGGDLMSLTAEYDIPTGATTITVLFTISDVADAFWDSVLAVDYVEFQ
jgi:hypothetical protein